MMQPAQVPTTADMPLWVVALCLVLGLGTLGWMARAWFREWRAYRAGTLLPHHKLRPIPPTIQAQRSPWRFLIYAAQAAAVGGGMYISFFSDTASKGSPPPAAIAVAFIGYVCLVAFATAVLTVLTDWTTRTVGKVAGGAAGRTRAEHAEQEALSVRPTTRRQQPEQIVGRHGAVEC
ncbi:hypothetical protein [Methylobacterium sp. WL8]|uniref:hypothetical protein n=1 Tax=Methylobacterium sp. WL8 TaxID=2603899 RepID=UPI0011CC2D6F|nr:hypothetical protein [Methylobacterium sp. WL8]TXN77389.1 hypothetical protein FV234_23810 [Methylobacterium sp. WL8]